MFYYIGVSLYHVPDEGETVTDTDGIVHDKKSFETFKFMEYRSRGGRDDFETFVNKFRKKHSDYDSNQNENIDKTNSEKDFGE